MKSRVGRGDVQRQNASEPEAALDLGKWMGSTAMQTLTAARLTAARLSIDGDGGCDWNRWDRVGALGDDRLDAGQVGERQGKVVARALFIRAIFIKIRHQL